MRRSRQRARSWSAARSRPPISWGRRAAGRGPGPPPPPRPPGRRAPRRPGGPRSRPPGARPRSPPPTAAGPPPRWAPGPPRPGPPPYGAPAARRRGEAGGPQDPVPERRAVPAERRHRPGGLGAHPQMRQRLRPRERQRHPFQEPGHRAGILGRDPVQRAEQRGPYVELLVQQLQQRRGEGGGRRGSGGSRRPGCRRGLGRSRRSGCRFRRLFRPSRPRVLRPLRLPQERRGQAGRHVRQQFAGVHAQQPCHPQQLDRPRHRAEAFRPALQLRQDLRAQHPGDRLALRPHERVPARQFQRTVAAPHRLRHQHRGERRGDRGRAPAVQGAEQPPHRVEFGARTVVVDPWRGQRLHQLADPLRVQRVRPLRRPAGRRRTLLGAEPDPGAERHHRQRARRERVSGQPARLLEQLRRPAPPHPGRRARPDVPGGLHRGRSAHTWTRSPASRAAAASSGATPTTRSAELPGRRV